MLEVFMSNTLVVTPSRYCTEFTRLIGSLGALINRYARSTLETIKETLTLPAENFSLSTMKLTVSQCWTQVYQYSGCFPSATSSSKLSQTRKYSSTLSPLPFGGHLPFIIIMKYDLNTFSIAGTEHLSDLEPAQAQKSYFCFVFNPKIFGHFRCQTGVVI